MKTQEEILERYNERKDGDSLGFEVDEYPEWLTFENVKKLGILNEDGLDIFEVMEGEK